MKDFIKTYWKTLLFFAIVGLVGGFFTGIYLLDSYPQEIKDQLIQELNGFDAIPVDILVGIVTAVQSVGYCIVLGGLGIFIAKKIGLWKDEKTLTKTPLTITLIFFVIGGLLMILPDLFFFNGYSEVIKNSYANKPSLDYVIASVTYGAVIEEVMLRLFMMSLVAFGLQKLFKKQSDKPSSKILSIANVISALLFAAGHLPATVMMIGTSPLIIARCFLLNGGLGFLFGYLYQKYGLRYAIIAHGGCHIVSKLIWILFI